MRLNANPISHVDAMDIEIALTTVAMCAVGAIQGALLVLVHQLEQEKALGRPRQRLARLKVPYEKRRFILEELSDDECEFHFRYVHVCYKNLKYTEGSIDLPNLKYI